MGGNEEIPNLIQTCASSSKQSKTCQFDSRDILPLIAMAEIVVVVVSALMIVMSMLMIVMSMLMIVMSMLMIVVGNGGGNEAPPNPNLCLLFQLAVCTAH